MTSPSAPAPTTHRLRQRRTGTATTSRGVNALVARISLVVALLWPILIYIFSASSPNTGNAAADQEIRSMKEYASFLGGRAKEEAQKLRSKMKEILGSKRHEIVGYGSHLPRVAVVVVGTNPEPVIRSVESVFR